MVFTPVSKIFKVYHGAQFYIGKPNTLKTTDLHGIDKHYNIKTNVSKVWFLDVTDLPIS
jgi:hypothetical protein